MAPPVPPGMALVFALVAAALLLFVTERIPSDTTALAVVVALVVFEPWTRVSATEAISGFASPATLTIVAMYMLSEGVKRTGLAAGVVNNTPIVAVFIPMITDLAGRHGLSPSKLLLPLSYAAMLGGTLTLVGTATNILASDLSRQLLGHPLSMFEFTKLGVLVFLAGAAYLLTVGWWLTPARIDPDADLTRSFALENHLVRLVVRESSPLVGLTVDEAVAELGDDAADLDVLQIERDGESYLATSTDRQLEAGDLLTVRTTLQVANRVATDYGLRHRHRDEVTEDDLSETPHEGTPAEVVMSTVPTTSSGASRVQRSGTASKSMWRSRIRSMRRLPSRDHGFRYGLTRGKGRPLLSIRFRPTIQSFVSRSVTVSAARSAHTASRSSIDRSASAVMRPYHAASALNAPPEVPLMPTRR
jgi:hypothetical protein